MRKQTLSLLMIMPLTATQPNPAPPKLPPEIELHKIRLERRALEQVIEVLNKPDACKCLQHADEELIACMDYASKEEARTTFSKMSYQARVDYLTQMNLLEYKRFLDIFENENQWKETLAKLPDEEQMWLPQTVLEQLIMIRDTWITCSSRRVGVYSSGKKDPPARDIAAWRNKTLDGYEEMHGSCPVLWQWLDARFMEQKIKMLHELKKQSAHNQGATK